MGCSTDECERHGGYGRWTKSNLTWRVNSNTLPTLITRYFAETALKEALHNVSKACGLKFSEADPGDDQDLELEFSKIDGEGGVLGRAFYPRPNNPEAGKVILDASEDWAYARLVFVLMHEIGHALGLEHSEDMDDVLYSKAIEPPLRDYSANDKARLRALYGPSWLAPPKPRISRWKAFWRLFFGW